MCGICGIAYRNKSETLDRSLLEMMNSRMLHRGPDDEGSAIFNHAGLAMRRLSIIDLGGGHQPIFNEAGNLAIVFNGEIYNYRELNRVLAGLGHHFTTNSDTEVILHGYEQWGTECVNHLNGMFAFAIWNNDRDELFLARDPVGVKPLYLYEDGKRLLFASEIKSLLAADDIPREIDPSALSDYLTFLYVPPPRTMLKGITNLPPGHWAIWRDGVLRVTEYWAGPKAAFEPEPAEPVMPEAVLDQLTAAVKRHLISDVPVGCLLSGGIDSSAIAALMAKELGPSFKTFTAAFPNAGIYDERRHARAVAKHIGSDHHEIEISSKAVDLLDKIIWHLDEPLADASVIPNYLVSQLAGAHVKVALSGIGGDEMFGGYRRYFAHHFARFGRFLPIGMMRSGLSLSNRLFPVSGATRVGNGMRLAHKFIAHLHDDPERRYLGWNAFFTADMKESLFQNGWRQSQSDSLTEAQRWFDRVPSGDLTRRAMYVDMKTYLPGDPLLLADKLSMAHSLELRVPFLDRELIEYASGIPAKQHGSGLATKQLLRKAVAHLLPDSILKRPKQGFGTPIDLWLRGEARPLVEDVLSAKTLRDRGWFNAAPVQAMLEDQNSGRHDYSQHIWALVVFELWQRQFVDSKPLVKCQ